MSKDLEAVLRAALMFAAMFVITAIVYAVARKYRGRKDKNIEETSDLMSKFRDLHSEGGLSDEEFRNIKTKLAIELKSELNSNTSTD